MSRPICSSTGRSASSRVLISSFSWLIDACVTDTLANNCMAMAEHTTLEQASDDELARRGRGIMAGKGAPGGGPRPVGAPIPHGGQAPKKTERPPHPKGRHQGAPPPPPRPKAAPPPGG